MGHAAFPPPRSRHGPAHRGQHASTFEEAAATRLGHGVLSGLLLDHVTLLLVPVPGDKAYADLKRLLNRPRASDAETADSPVQDLRELFTAYSARV
jgi:alcohol dehydrogenase class IV